MSAQRLLAASAPSAGPLALRGMDSAASSRTFESGPRARPLVRLRPRLRARRATSGPFVGSQPGLLWLLLRSSLTATPFWTPDSSAGCRLGSRVAPHSPGSVEGRCSSSIASTALTAGQASSTPNSSGEIKEQVRRPRGARQNLPGWLQAVCGLHHGRLWPGPPSWYPASPALPDPLPPCPSVKHARTDQGSLRSQRN